MARSIAPLLNAGVAPGAEGVLDGAVLVKQGVTHPIVADGRLGLAVAIARGWDDVVGIFRVVDVLVGPLLGDIAVIILKVVDAPISKCGGVDFFMAERTFVATASKCACFSLLVNLRSKVVVGKTRPTSIRVDAQL